MIMRVSGASDAGRKPGKEGGPVSVPLMVERTALMCTVGMEQDSKFKSAASWLSPLLSLLSGFLRLHLDPVSKEQC